VIVGCLFLVNLFIGVIFYNFTVARNNSRHKFLTDSQLQWIQLQKLIVAAEPDFQYIKAPKNPFRRMIFEITHTKLFEAYVFFIITISVIIICLEFEGANNEYMKIVRILDAGCIILFIIEIILKFLALSVNGFFYDPWNKVDFILIFIATFEIIYNYVFPLSRELSLILRLIRVLRIIRVFRIIFKIEGLQRLLRTLNYSMPTILNIFVLLFMILYIYTTLACAFFRRITKGDGIDDYVNFKNFFFGMMTLIKIGTADGWPDIMYDVAKTYCKNINIIKCYSIFLLI
jgi:hypothetical protein